MREFQAAQCIGAYVSVDREIETHGLIRQLLAVGRRVCVPAFVGEYVAAEIADFDADLQPGQFGILEPRTVRPAQPEVWLVPGLGFDRRGNRLGRGRGFFDALLRRTLALKIALAHEFQVLERIPAEAHDARMDRIVTETQVYECGGER
jgi:5-formyltetrahydrofolate cyclo-ligase